VDAEKGPTKGLALDVGTGKRTHVKTIVSDGIVITPVRPLRSGDKSGKKIGDRPPPEQEMVIAVDPEEAAALTRVLAGKADVHCVARSGRPDDPGPSDVVIPDINPAPKVIVTEILRGSSRETIVAPVRE
jgi:hypothetical protein